MHKFCYIDYVCKAYTLEFKNLSLGLTGNDDAWHICITDTDSVLGFALGALFVRETFIGGSKAKVTV